MELKKTALNPCHHRLKARMVAFAGWEMPLQYGSIIEEHLAVRKRAGIFDISHMGQIIVKGRDASLLLQSLTCNDIGRLAPGRVQYNAFTNAQGGIIDDITIYAVSAEEYLIVSNAANHRGDYLHLQSELKKRPLSAQLYDESARWHLLALQGPESARIIGDLVEPSLADLPYFHFTDLQHKGSLLRISRTGYTGEDGFEIYSSLTSGIELWDLLTTEGRRWGLRPVGLGARDSLRLEALYPLYGHELRDCWTPIESGLSWIVKEKKPPFLGQEKILEQRREGAPGRVVGFQLKERGLARSGYPVWDAAGGKIIGQALSASYSPILERGIGSAYLPLDSIEEGTPIYVEIRKKLLPAQVRQGAFVQGGAGKATGKG